MKETKQKTQRRLLRVALGYQPLAPRSIITS